MVLSYTWDTGSQNTETDNIRLVCISMYCILSTNISLVYLDHISQ